MKELNCKDCLHHFACLVNGEYSPTPCRAYKNKADYREQSVGEWIEREVTLSWLEDDVDVFYVCSNCKIETPFTSKYCHDCGAKMKGGAE